MSKVYCGLGSNLGNKIANVNLAIEYLNSEKTKVVRRSSFYETKPLGDEHSPNYVNAVVEIETELTPFDLLKFLKYIEKKIGRTKTYRWGPREIDIDILLFDSEIISSDKLTIPHKEICNRDFVLVPLKEIAGDIEIPGSGLKISECINNLRNHYILKKI